MIIKYECEYCGMQFQDKKTAFNHEIYCVKNPDRQAPCKCGSINVKSRQEPFNSICKHQLICFDCGCCTQFHYDYYKALAEWESMKWRNRNS